MPFFSPLVSFEIFNFSPKFFWVSDSNQDFPPFLIHLLLDSMREAIPLLIHLMSLGGSLLSSVPHHAIILKAWFSGGILSIGRWRSMLWILTPGLCPIVGACLLLTHRRTQQEEVEICWGRICAGIYIPSLSRPSFKFMSCLFVNANNILRMSKLVLETAPWLN